MGLKKCIRLYPHYLAQNFKSLMEYRIDFFLTQWNGQLRLQQFFAERRLSRE